MKDIVSATCSDDFDFVLTDNGMLSVETSTAKALISMLKLDFTSNDDWSLDHRLGVHWVSKNNDGLLQLKGTEAQIVQVVQNKISSIKGVREVEKIEISRGVNRKLYLSVTIVAYSGEKILLEKVV
jgi:hypothetical protein